MLNRFCGRALIVDGNIAVWSVIVLLLAVSGCGGESVPEEYSGPPSVSGAVTLDGVPLTAATVSFETSESGPFQAVTNDSGQYAFESEEATPPLGKYLVRITGSAAAPDSESAAVPARYNSETELVVDVMPGQNPIDFPLMTGSVEDLAEE